MKLVNVDVSRVKEVMRHGVCVCVCDPRGIYGDSLFKWNPFQGRSKQAWKRNCKKSSKSLVLTVMK